MKGYKHGRHHGGWFLKAAVFTGIAVLASILVPKNLEGQGAASAQVSKAAKGHGEGWQQGLIKNWVASGTLTLHRDVEKGRQEWAAFPITLIHAAGAGGAAKDDKFQRLIFQAPIAPAEDGKDNQGAPANIYDRTRLRLREGTDGVEHWQAADGKSVSATGPALRYLESQTIRSIAAFLSYSKNGKPIEDVTSMILNRTPALENKKIKPNSKSDANVTPDYEAAKDKCVIETRLAGKSGLEAKPTRYYVDDKTSLVVRLEFEYASGRDPFSGNSLPLLEVYELADYRDVPISGPDPLQFGRSAKKETRTVKFPFKIVRYIAGRKAETIVLTKVMMNQNLSPDNFRR